MSPRMASDLTPRSRTSCATASASAWLVRALTMMCAPSPASFNAVARPILRPEPVIRATFPSSLPMQSSQDDVRDITRPYILAYSDHADPPVMGENLTAATVVSVEQVTAARSGGRRHGAVLRRIIGPIILVGGLALAGSGCSNAIDVICPPAGQCPNTVAGHGGGY